MLHCWASCAMWPLFMSFPACIAAAAAAGLSVTFSSSPDTTDANAWIPQRLHQQTAWKMPVLDLLLLHCRAGRARGFDQFFEQQRRSCNQMLRVGIGPASAASCLLLHAGCSHQQMMFSLAWLTQSCRLPFGSSRPWAGVAPLIRNMHTEWVPE